jgi:hypothetical protein
MNAVQNAPRLATLLPQAATAGASSPPSPGPTTESAGGPPPGPPPHEAPADTQGPGKARGAFARFIDAPALRAPESASPHMALPPSSAVQARLFR